VKTKKTYGYPEVFRPCYEKNSAERVFRICHLLNTMGMDKGATMAYQTLSDAALKNIGRKNLTLEHFSALMKQYNEAQIPTYSELILGLPGETVDSFCEGICMLLEHGQHFAVEVYPCELLPNSQMGQKAYRERYQIGSTRVPFRIKHTTNMENPNEITEYAEYTTSTYSMCREEWADSLLFANYIQGLHNLGLLRAVAIYLRYVQGVSFLRFYRELIAYSAAHPELLLGRLYARILSLCKGVACGENEFVLQCEDTDRILWGFDELLFLYAYKELDVFYREIRDWIVRTYGGAEPLVQLVAYQQDIIKKIGQPTVRIRAAYDYYDFFRHVYLNDPIPLEKTDILLEVQDAHPVESFAQFARETVWYGRNRREPDYTSGFYPIRELSAEIQ
jgi:putative methyltransferase